MTGRIILLPDPVIDRIAAGEVVERPASVLKELLENAADAGATRVEAEVSGPLPFVIRVSDDGCGMTPEEIRTAVRRHTTSKIAAAEDLLRLTTYGFRGEALPSIASVSRMRIVSRVADRASGAELVIEGGEVKSDREAGAPAGTTVEVADLFWNVPARRKFLKSSRTEMGHLWEVFHGVAIPGAGVAFRMKDGRYEREYEARETPLERARREAGEEGKYLVPLERTSLFFRVSGWAGLPHVSRMTASGIRFFVNGRHFRDRGVFAALREAYRGILPADRLPVACLFIECDPAEVDVNVHPGKTEVRFRYGKDLFELVRHAVGVALGEIRAPAGAPLPGAGELEESGAPGLSLVAGMAAPGERQGSLVEVSQPGARSEETRGAEGGGGAPLRTGFASLRPVGQVLGTFLVCEGGGEVVIVDQHAADERIVFSRLKDAWLGKNAPVQRWLVPQVVALPGMDRRERVAVERFLAEVGFTFETFGPETLKLTGGPAILGTFDVQRWWRDFRDFVGSQESAPKGIFDAEQALWRIACHTSVRAGKALEKEGIRALLQELDRAVAAHSCPHGRPVWVRISAAEMGRMFGRS